MSTIALATSRGEGDDPAKDSECSSPLAAATIYVHEEPVIKNLWQLSCFSPGQ